MGQPLFLTQIPAASKLATPVLNKKNSPQTPKETKQGKKNLNKGEPAYLPTRILIIFCISALKERSLSLKVSFTKGKTLIHLGLETSRVRKLRNSSPRSKKEHIWDSRHKWCLRGHIPKRMESKQRAQQERKRGAGGGEPAL